MTESVRYCTTEDGATIAFTTHGEGTPFVWIPSSLQGGRSIYDSPLVQRWARHFQVVRYDCRGLGQSAMSTLDLSFEARRRDLEAIVAANGDGPVILRAMNNACAVAIAYAVAHPDRVRAMVLFAPYASGQALEEMRPGVRAALGALVRADSNFGARAVATAISGQSEQIDHVAFENLPATFDALGQAFVEFDVTPLLSRVTVPTLVIHGLQDAMVPLALGQAVAASIEGSRLFTYDGPSMVSSRQTMNEVSEAVGDFVNIHNMPEEIARESATPSSVQTVLFTDLVGHTEMMQRFGDERGRVVLREHERITRELLKQHGGAEVKTMGDGFMASFASVTRAMDCAIALQRAFAAHEGEPLQIRVGLNAGEPIEEDGDLFGSTVIMASRIAAQAGAGEILIPEPLRHLLTGKSYVYADRGETILKGFEDAVRLYEVRWRD